MRTQTWSKTLQDETRKIFQELTASAFMNGERCHLKCYDGRFGFVKLTDALMDKLIIHDKEDESKTYLFSSILEMITNGWVVD